MSATKIAASFRVSLTALAPKQRDSPVAVAWAWLHFHAALRTRGQPEVQSGVRAADPKAALMKRSASLDLVRHVLGGRIEVLSTRWDWASLPLLWRARLGRRDRR